MPRRDRRHTPAELARQFPHLASQGLSGGTRPRTSGRDGQRARWEAQQALGVLLAERWPGVFIPHYWQDATIGAVQFDFADPKTHTALVISHAWCWGAEIGWTILPLLPSEILEQPEKILRRIAQARRGTP